MSEQTRIEYPNFINVTAIVYSKQDSQKPILLKARINPISITSYIEGVYPDEKGGMIPCTTIYAGGVSYSINMKIDEVDKMMLDIERGLNIDNG